MVVELLSSTLADLHTEKPEHENACERDPISIPVQGRHATGEAHRTKRPREDTFKPVL